MPQSPSAKMIWLLRVQNKIKTQDEREGERERKRERKGVIYLERNASMSACVSEKDRGRTFGWVMEEPWLGDGGACLI